VSDQYVVWVAFGPGASRSPVAEPQAIGTDTGAAVTGNAANAESTAALNGIHEIKIYGLHPGKNRSAPELTPLIHNYGVYDARDGTCAP